MGKGKKPKSKARSKAKRAASSPTVTVRFANPGRRANMAKKSNPKKRKTARRNPGKKGNPRRRRRNPETFAQRGGKLLAGAVVAVGTGVLVTYAASKIQPGTAISMYGIPALAFLAGVGIARTMPTLGVGMALGSASPFVIPVATKLLTATAPATTTPATTAALRAVTMSRAYRSMRAVDARYGGMSAVDQAYAR